MLIKHYCISSLILLTACTTPEPDEHTGAVDLALVTTGGDGATYRLTPGARLSVTTTDPDGIPNYDVGLDGDSSFVTITVEPGGYAAELYHPDGYTIDWPLERTLNGDTSTVTGHLITPQPVALDVIADQTTSLVLQFTVETGGTITFDHGNLDVSVGVGEHQANGFTASADGIGNVAGTPLFDGPFATGLAGLLPGAGATDLHVAAGGHLTGSWSEVGGTIDPDGLTLSVCAPFQLDGATGSGHAGLAALIAEADHGDAPSFLFGHSNICVSDDGTVSRVRIRWSREGAADTQAFQTVLGTAPTLFHVQLIGELPTRAYNSQTGVFDVDAMLGTRTLPMTVRLQVRDDNDLGTFWYNARIDGTETFTLTGTP